MGLAETFIATVSNPVLFLRELSSPPKKNTVLYVDIHLSIFLKECDLRLGSRKKILIWDFGSGFPTSKPRMRTISLVVHAILKVFGIL